MAWPAARGHWRLQLYAGGKLTWQVPGDFEEKETSIIVSVCDAGGQECFHTFTLSIRE